MRMVCLTTCADGVEARIVAARLGAEGIVWSLRGGHDGPLAIGAVDLLVDEDDLEAARALLGSDESEDDGPTQPARPTSARQVLTVVAVLALLVLFALVRMGAKV
jgi:hypothetical protein